MKHNGWTNYATWRVNLENFDDIDTDHWEDEIVNQECTPYELGQHLKSYMEEMIEMQVINLNNNTAENYALAFINEVNWSEIASHIIDTYRENYCCDNCNEKLDEQDHFCSDKCKNEYELLATHPKG